MRSISCCLAPWALVLAACAAAPELPPLDSHEPASPDATEAPLPPPRRAFASLDDGDPDPTAKSAPQGAYVCPMHEEVVSDAPGRCPRCRMALVKREAK